MNDDPWDDMPLSADDAAVGEWLRKELLDRYGNETEAWAVERIHRVLQRLNTVRAACTAPGCNPHPLRAEILWIGMMNAFATPGNWIFITRELLQRFTVDDPVAFVIAHEAAHHDLGHTRVVTPALAKARRLPGGETAFLALKAMRVVMEHPAHEAAADAYGIDLCIAAGYDPYRCLELFDALEAHLLDHGDLDGVFGPDASTNGEGAEGLAGLWGAASRKLWRIRRGYPSLRERRAALERHIRTG